MKIPELECPKCLAKFSRAVWDKRLQSGNCPNCSYSGTENQFKIVRMFEMKEQITVTGWLEPTPFLLQEGIIKAEDVQADFKIKGLLLPKDKISRNNVLYDWESVKQKYKDFEGVKVNYNHIIDDNTKPVGKVTKTWIKEKDDDDGIAGMYYEAQIDRDSEYADSILKGYLDKVSLQVQASAQKSEKNEQGEVYTRAWIRSPLEMSVVKVPGFNETSFEVALAEAFKNQDANDLFLQELLDLFKEGSKLSTSDKNFYYKQILAGKAKSAIINSMMLTGLSKGDAEKIYDRLEDEGAEYEESLAESEKQGQIKVNGKAITVTLSGSGDKAFDSIGNNYIQDMNGIWNMEKNVSENLKEDHLAKGEFPFDEFKKGFGVEKDEHTTFHPIEIARIVLDHLMEDEYYYTTQVEDLTDNEADDLLELFKN